MNSLKYQFILSNNLLASAIHLNLSQQQDNDQNPLKRPQNVLKRKRLE